jgi:hypothetical protein
MFGRTARGGVGEGSLRQGVVIVLRRSAERIGDAMSCSVQFAIALFGFIMPPKDHDQKSLYEWYQRVGIAIASLFVLLVGFIAVAYGAVPGVPGFASSYKIEQVKRDLDFLSEKSLSSEIRDLRDRHCRAKPASDERKALGDLLDNDLNEFRRRAGREYRLPPCDEM